MRIVKNWEKTVLLLVFLLSAAVLRPVPARAVEEVGQETEAVSPDQPVLKAAKGGYGQITIRWKKVKGARSYLVYRKGGGAKKYKKLAELTAAAGTSYVDRDVKNGIAYTYTVRAVKLRNGRLVTGPYDADGVTGLARIPAVVLKSCVVSGKKAAVTWAKVSGADGYRILRRADGGTAEVLKDVKASKSSYTDKYLLIGHSYTYYVLALFRDGSEVRFSEQQAPGLTASLPLAAPQSFSASAVSGRVYLSWKPVEGAEGYRIYRRPASGMTEDFVRIASLSSPCRCTYWDSGAVPGEKNVYLVRAQIRANGKTILGEMSGEEKVTVLPGMPVLTGVTASGRQDRITWKQVPGADGYMVYKKNALTKKKWVRVCDAGADQTQALAVRDEGTTTYTVKAWVSSGEKQLFSKKNMTLNNAERRYGSHHVLFIGDSITWGQSWSARRAALTYPKRIAQLTGISCTNAGIRGCTVARSSDTDTTGIVIRMENGAFDLQKATMVVLAAGTNDYGGGVPLGDPADRTEATFYGALNIWFTMLREQKPEMPVVIVLPGYRQRIQQDYRFDGFAVKNAAGYTLEDYRTALRKTAERYGAVVYDPAVSGVLSEKKGSRLCDGLHPTEEGYLALGDALAKVMEPLLKANMPQAVPQETEPQETAPAEITETVP